MRDRFSLTLSVLLLTGFAYAGEGPLTLERAYELALQRSDVLATQEETVNQAEERVWQAWAPFMPSIGASASYLQQQEPTSVVARALFPTTQSTARASLSQNLFKGFRDFSALRQRKSEHAAAEAAREQARIQLYVDTAQAFYNVQLYTRELEAYQSEIDAHRKRKVEIDELKKLARAREADRVSIDSSIANLEASIAQARGILAGARETLSFLTGLPVEVTLAEAVSPVAPDLGGVATWLEALDRRPDLVQAQQSYEAAERAVGVARAGHLPSADLSANYYFARPGAYEGVNWDVQVGVTLPIFSGGLTQSQLREAASQRHVKEVALQLARRQAEREIRSIFETARADFEQLQKLGTAAELTRKRYELLLADNRLGLASNLDVLQALANAHQTQRSRDHAQFIAQFDYAKLQAVSRGLSHRKENL